MSKFEKNIILHGDGEGECDHCGGSCDGGDTSGPSSGD
jgi:hypothetical protein